MILRVRYSWPLGSCSPACAPAALCCVCGVLGHWAPVQRCARSVRCVACAVSWATWLLLTSVLARCVALRARCPAPLGLCSLVCSFGTLCCVCGVLGHLAPVHRCARPVRCVACAVSWASWLPFIGVPARCDVLRVRCPGPLGSCSLCAQWLRCFACAMSWATWLPFIGVLARCIVLRVRCPGSLGSYPAVCVPCAVCCVCGVLGHLAGVPRCTPTLRCIARAVSWVSWLLFTGVLVRCVVLCVRCPGPLGSCAPMCCLAVLCRVCRVLGHLFPAHRCVCLLRCLACAVSWATWLVFTGVPAGCVVLRLQ